MTNGPPNQNGKKRVPLHESHILCRLLAYFYKISVVVKLRSRSIILSKAILKNHLEVEICNIKVGTLVFWSFSSLGWVFLPRQSYTRAFPQELHILPQFLGNFVELNSYRKMINSRIILYELIFKLGFKSKVIQFINNHVLTYFHLEEASS